MVSPIRPFTCLFMSVVKQGGKHQFTDLSTVLLKQTQVSDKVNFLLICGSEKCHFRDRMFGIYVYLVRKEKKRFSRYLGDDGAKELVIICDHVHFSGKNEWTEDCLESPEGAGP